jgi:MSHA pilin protein MshA
MKSLMSNKGFTLIELVMVIVILGILAAVAVPKFSDISGQAKIAAEAGVVGGVRMGITTLQMGFLSGAIDSTGGGAGNFGAGGYVTFLDTAEGTTTAAAADNPYFGRVLSQGGVSTDWTKPAAQEYVGPTQSTTVSYTYTQSDGSFMDLTP